MQKSKNSAVQKFLFEIKDVDFERFQILDRLREIVFAREAKINEKIMYGGIMFFQDENIGGLFVQKNHISFEFSNGFRLRDPERILEGSGKFRRHLKIRSLADLENKKVAFFVQQFV